MCFDECANQRQLLGSGSGGEQGRQDVADSACATVVTAGQTALPLEQGNHRFKRFIVRVVYGALAKVTVYQACGRVTRINAGGFTIAPFYQECGRHAGSSGAAGINGGVTLFYRIIHAHQTVTDV